MAQHNSPSQADAASSWLLPTNRKLRNLIAISLRNISLTRASPARKKGQIFDDDALPQTLKSPAKLLALQEQKALGHSRSSTDLRAVVEENALTEDDGTSVVVDSANGSPVAAKTKGKENVRRTSTTAPKRPPFRKLRRRSTLEWLNATPQRRQERLEDVTMGRMVDVFFSLHVQGVEGKQQDARRYIPVLTADTEPVYISETVEHTMNPSFRHVDWDACGPGVTRLDSVTIRVWVKNGRSTDWQQLLQMNIALEGLHYLGRTVRLHSPC